MILDLKKQFSLHTIIYDPLHMVEEKYGEVPSFKYAILSLYYITRAFLIVREDCVMA